MLLVVDVGNTQTHFGAYEGTSLLEHWRFATVRQSTADELGAALANLLELRGMKLGGLDDSIVSSTVPELAPEWTEMARRYLGHEMPVVGPGLRTGMPIRMDNPRELGADRLVNAVAAYEIFHAACVVVDFGTAITYDVVSADGDYLGGIISPGVQISLEALSSRAAKLPTIDLGEPRALIGKSTVDAIRSGVIYGFAAAVDGIVGRLRAELGPDVATIATGGLARVIVPHTVSIGRIDDLLTLEGLRLIRERNR
ncbi:MAG TPA: type III pantothenate kinase [Solirubrobacteraceae bacterium]|nr:type III pantothenate kinase [Solirubrobacteraceae bacterium]